MKPREVSQALVNLMEKTLRKEKSENLTEQTPLRKASQVNGSGGKSEMKIRPENERKGPKDKSVEAKCTACSRGKRKGIPPKVRWKEEQKEKAQGMEAIQEEGKENQTEVASSSGEVIARTARRGERARSIFEGLKGGAGILGGAAPQAPVACVSGTPRDLNHVGAVQRVAPTSGGSNGPRSISPSEVIQQVLHSRYKFK
jgi:hypothetical protein